MTYHGFELEREIEPVDEFPPELAPRARRVLAEALARGEARHAGVQRNQQAIESIRSFPFPIVAELRDTQGYVLASELGKSIFDYNSEVVRSHQDDWSKLLRWLKKLA